MGQGTPTERIKEYWNEQARQHGADLAATTPDPLAKELEIEAIKRALDPRLDTLEVGCGNGYNLIALADSFSGNLFGVDFAATMIEMAKNAVASRADVHRFHFETAGILDDLGSIGSFEQVFTNRCLINLTSLDDQVRAVENLGSLVPVGKRIALIESTQQGQEQINKMRAIIGLDAIPYHWHNHYIDEPAFLARSPKYLRHIRTDNFASLYFVISRVFNAKLTPAGEKPDYLSEINKIAAKLPSFGDCAPLKLFLFEKVAT